MPTQLRQAAGSVLVVGLGGVELSGLERAWLRLVRPAGIILFRRNIADAAGTRELLRAASVFCQEAAMRCVDVEGGTVDRLRDAISPMPSAKAVAATGKQALMERHGELIAREVAAFGFNTTLAPVLDLALPQSAAVMGSRAPSETPMDVVQYARNFLAGLSKQGVNGCGKHFPGLGGGTLDSHQQTPAIERTLNQLWREDLLPYRELAGELPMVMINHAMYPLTPSKRAPATASHYWASKVLRQRIGYRGVIFSDDMEMGGILNFAGIEEAAILAVRAGIDLIEVCHSPELILRCYESILREAERSVVFRRVLLERVRRGSRLRARLFGAGIRPALSAARMMALRERVRAFAALVEVAA